MRIFLAIGFIFLYGDFFAQLPVAYYKFDNSAQDFSGNHNDGILHGDIHTSMDRFGNPCGAYRFDGRSAYIDVPHSTSLGSPVNSFTIATWYRLDNIFSNTWLTVLCKGDGASEQLNNPQYRLQVQQNITPVTNSCTPGIADGSSTISMNTAFTKCDADFRNHLFTAGKWSFYVLVYNGSSVTAYMDNRKVFEYSYSSALSANSSPLYIGMDEPGNKEYFEGSLDDLRIYNYALNEKEISNLYNEQSKTSGSGEEFDLPMMQNINALMPSNRCEAKINFTAPVVKQSTCGTVTVRQIYGKPSGSAFVAGKHLITYEAVSTSGYEQRVSFYVIVKDVTPPTLFVATDTILFVNKGEKGTQFSYKSPSATDNCGIKSLQLVDGLASNSFFPVNKRQIITYKAIDVNGNSSEKTFVIDVKEKNDVIIVNPPSKPSVIKIDTLPVTIVTPAPPVVPTVDTIITPPVADPLPIDTSGVTIPTVHDRKKGLPKIIEVDSLVLEAILYDNGIFDGDTVSILLNDKVLLLKQEVNTRGTKFKIEIDPTRDNELIMYAENLGSIPPNTGILVVYDGAKRHSINFLSTFEQNGVITIRKKKGK